MLLFGCVHVYGWCAPPPHESKHSQELWNSLDVDSQGRRINLEWRDPLLLSGFEAAWHRMCMCVCAMLRCTFRCLNLWSGQGKFPV
jgi:hypothetical protein